MKLARSFGRNLHIKKDTVYFLFFNPNLVVKSTQNIAVPYFKSFRPQETFQEFGLYKQLIKGGESSSQFRWLTIAKIEL